MQKRACDERAIIGSRRLRKFFILTVKWGARPPRAFFSAPSRKNPARTKQFQSSVGTTAPEQRNARARSTTSGAGALPSYCGVYQS
jgi:hypothetical protein